MVGGTDRLSVIQRKEHKSVQEELLYIYVSVGVIRQKRGKVVYVKVFIVNR